MSEYVNARGLIDQTHYNEGMQAVEAELAKIRQDKELKTPDGKTLFVSYYTAAEFVGYIDYPGCPRYSEQREVVLLAKDDDRGRN